MAKFTPGPAIAEIRGSTGGTTFSQNRFGAYIRRRSVPTKSFSGPATLAKTVFANASSQWRDLTEANRLSWRTFAENNPVIDALGNQQTLTGHQWFVRLRSRQLYFPFGPQPTTPPAQPSIFPFAVFGVAPGFTTESIEVTWTPPTPSDFRLWLYAAPLLSTGQTWVENQYRLVVRSDPDPDSPLQVAPNIIARFGAIPEGSHLLLRGHIYEVETGHVSIGRLVKLGPIPAPS